MSRARSWGALPALVVVLVAACSHEAEATRDAQGTPGAGSREAFTESARAAAGIQDAPPPPDASAVPEVPEENPRFGRAQEGVPAFGGEEVNLDPTGELTEDDGVENFAGAAIQFRRVRLGGDGGAGGGIVTTGWGPSSNALFGASHTESKLAEPPKPTHVETWKRSRLVPNASRLKVGDTEELPLDGAEMTVRVDGTRARVVLDCFFRNDRAESLEGMFELRLPDDASPFYFAFGECVGIDVKARVDPPTEETDETSAPSTPAPSPPANVQGMFLGAAAATAAASAPEGIRTSRQATWTEPKEARMVPREKAAWAYTEVSRRRVDPALMEWSGAGVFSARVFPIAPAKVHRVVVGYDVDLVPVGDDFELRLDLPPGVPQRAVTISLAKGVTVEFKSTNSTLDVDTPAPHERVLYSFRDPATNAIELRINRPGATVLTGDDAAAGSCFAVTFRPELPARTAAAAGSPQAVFLLDTSLSSGPERFPVWLKLAREVLERNRGSIREFAVLCFDVRTRWWKEGFVPNTKENVDALVAHAETLALEGATDLGAALAEAVSPAWDPASSRSAREESLQRARWDLFLLSDGAATWGASDLAALDTTLERGHRGALFAYQTGQSGGDVATLAHLARETGGALVPVLGEAELVAAATAHTLRGFRIRGLSIDGGSDLLLAGRPASVFPGQTLRLAGRGTPKTGAAIVLAVEQDGVQSEVRVVPARVLRSELAPRAYGQIAVGQIEELGDVPSSPAQAYATHYRVVGSTCSLLMLETEEDYARYGIKPEEDAARIGREPADAWVARAVLACRDEACDPRAGILAWLRRLEASPGVEFRAPEELVAAIRRMPAKSFAIDMSPLVCKPRAWTDVPGKLTEEYASRELTYDAVTAEAKRVHEADGAADALRVLSSLVEANPGDTALARDVGFSALEWGLSAPAIHLFRRVARARPYEPETYRALADAFARSGNADLAIVYGEAALAGKWDERFGAFRLIAAMDHMRLLRRIDRGEIATSVPEFAAARRKALEKEFLVAPPRLLVVVTWNTDRTDVDLHVTDPRGEECFYSHPRTAIGGAITADVTQGYGPEMFVVASPAAGDYRVQVHYFASDRSRASLRSKVLATVYDRWGTSEEKVTRRVVLLEQGDRTEDVATVRIGD